MFQTYRNFMLMNTLTGCNLVILTVHSTIL